MRTPSLIVMLFTVCTIVSCSKKTDSLPITKRATISGNEFAIDSANRVTTNTTNSVTKVELVKLVLLAYNLISIDDFDKLSDEASFVNDLGFTSLDFWELILAIEQVFLLEIPDEDSERINTIGDMARYIEEHIVPSTPNVGISDLFPPGSSVYPPVFGEEEEGECAYNEIVGSATTRNEKMRVELCGSGPNTRTKCYSWKIFSVSSGMIPMYFVSNEQAVQSHRGGNVWQFDSFVHQSVSKAGVEILYDAEVQNVNPTPTLKKSDLISYNDIAQMYLSFGIKVSIICDGLPMVYNKTTSTQQSWNVSE